MADRTITPEEEQMAKLASLAESKTKIAEAELKLAQAQKSLRDVANPPSPSLKDVAEANSTIALADQKSVQAVKDSFKGPDIKVLDGKITADGTFIESRILAAKSLSEAFDKLLVAIKSNETFKDHPATFIIYNAADFSSVELYYSIQAQISSLKDNFKNNIDNANQLLQPTAPDPHLAGGVFPMVAAFAVSGALRSVIDIISLFKTNISFSNFDLPIDDTLLIASFTNAVQDANKTWKVFYPAAYPIDLIPATVGSTDSKLITALQELRNLSNNMASLVQTFDKQLTQLQQDMLTATTDAVRQGIQDKTERLSTAKENLQQLLPVYTQFEKALVTADPTTNMSMQAVLVRAEKFIDRLSTDHTFIIKLSANSRGSNRIVDNLFYPSRITHSGGTQLSCLIFSKDGSIIFSHNTHSYIKYTKPDEIS